MARQGHADGAKEVRSYTLAYSYGAAALVSLALWAALIAALYALL